MLCFDKIINSVSTGEMSVDERRHSLNRKTRRDSSSGIELSLIFYKKKLNFLILDLQSLYNRLIYMFHHVTYMYNFAKFNISHFPVQFNKEKKVQLTRHQIKTAMVQNVLCIQNKFEVIFCHFLRKFF